MAGPIPWTLLLALVGAGLTDGRAESSGSGEPTSGNRLKVDGFATSNIQAVTAALIAEHASLQPGARTRIGVRVDVEEGWHIYAEQPGDAGLPTSVTWEGPPGILFGLLHWPPPRRFLDPGDITTFGYAGTVVPYSPLTVSDQAVPGQTVVIRATVKWLACRELCVPGSATLELELPVSSDSPTFSAHAELFDQTG